MGIRIFVRILWWRCAVRAAVLDRTAAGIAGRTEARQTAERAGDDRPNQQDIYNCTDHREQPLVCIVFEPRQISKLVLDAMYADRESFPVWHRQRVASVCEASYRKEMQSQTLYRTCLRMLAKTLADR